jgi:hypothetical protein
VSDYVLMGNPAAAADMGRNISRKDAEARSTNQEFLRGLRGIFCLWGVARRKHWQSQLSAETLAKPVAHAKYRQSQWHAQKHWQSQWHAWHMLIYPWLKRDSPIFVDTKIGRVPHFLPVIVLPTLVSIFPGAATTVFTVETDVLVTFLVVFDTDLPMELIGLKRDEALHAAGCTFIKRIDNTTTADRTLLILTIMVFTLF